MNRTDRVYIAGHRGLVGSALVRRLEEEYFDNLILRTRGELDLTDARAVRRFFEETRPEYVFMAAAKVGGILANATYPAEFIYQNIVMSANVIDAAYHTGVRKLMYFGSSCVYPRLAPQPMKEEHLLSGSLEPTNEPYAIAKIAGVKLCESYHRQYGAPFFSVMPTNLYGPNDNYDLQNSHVLAALIRKFHEAHITGASDVTVWGTGTARREFMHVDDLADACVHLMRTVQGGELVNIGIGEDVSINDLAAMIRDIVGYQGGIRFDPTKPDGTPRKLLDVSKLAALGWKPRIPLRAGITATYAQFATLPLTV